MNIFLLRGLVREKRHWGDFPHLIRKAFPKAQIHLLEIPGVGESAHLISPSNFDEIVEFMRNKQLESIQQGENNILFALSLGGMLSSLWMQKYPNDFKQTILVNTSLKGFSPLLRRLRPRAVLKFLQLTLTINIGMRELGILRLISNDTSKHEEILKSWISIQKDAQVLRASFYNQIKAALTFTPALEPPKARILILGAINDRLCHYSCSVELHKYWRGTLRLSPEGGHDLPIDQPDWLIEEMKNWIE
ncbi:MAG: pimeloyl-[acyl-carrier protein] methyl ester esterase [Thermoproteota archaeon]|jgi:pimeloyl-[acyl-carrier protein] methyl ester esterase